MTSFELADDLLHGVPKCATTQPFFTILHDIMGECHSALSEDYKCLQIEKVLTMIIDGFIMQNEVNENGMG